MHAHSRGANPPLCPCIAISFSAPSPGCKSHTLCSSGFSQVAKYREQELTVAPVKITVSPFYRKETFSFFIAFIFSEVDLRCANFCCTEKGPSHTYTSILFLIVSSIVGCPKGLDRVPCAAQQDLLPYPFSVS